MLLSSSLVKSNYTHVVRKIHIQTELVKRGDVMSKINITLCRTHLGNNGHCVTEHVEGLGDFVEDWARIASVR